METRAICLLLGKSDLKALLALCIKDLWTPFEALLELLDANLLPDSNKSGTGSLEFSSLLDECRIVIEPFHNDRVETRT
jgi:hypothetical protein